jgi:hypothetical protein
MTDNRSERRATPWGWIVLIWCAIAAIDACQTVLFLHTLDHERAWLPVFAVEFASWLPWLVATPFIMGLARRTPPFVRGTMLASLGTHLAAFAAIGLAAETWYVALQLAFNPWDYPQALTFTDAWRNSFPYQAPAFLIVYALIVAVTLILDGRDKLARQTTEAARLNAELSKAQLAALRRQVEPHFLFNALNSIAGLARDNQNAAAVSMIVGLSEFLRRTLADSDRAEVTLAEEVEYLERYLDIEKIRFGDRLQVAIDVPATLLNARVPNLLLQPLVENAIKHGIAKRVAGGSVRVQGACRDGSLTLRITNDVPALASDWATNTGTGLANLRTRLEILHAGKSALQLRRAGNERVEAIVILPFVEA